MPDVVTDPTSGVPAEVGDGGDAAPLLSPPHALATTASVRTTTVTAKTRMDMRCDLLDAGGRHGLDCQGAGGRIGRRRTTPPRSCQGPPERREGLYRLCAPRPLLQRVTDTRHMLEERHRVLLLGM